MQIDNSIFLAAHTHHCQKLPQPCLSMAGPISRAHGKPLYPQRPLLLGPLFTKVACGAVNTIKFHGKMTIAASLIEIDAPPRQPGWYRNQATENLRKRLDDNFGSTAPIITTASYP
jgi:hypothetical protein